MIAALIFDFDGLILDTETPDYQSWKEVYKTHGCELPIDLWYRNIGAVNHFDPYAYLEEQLGKSLDREAIYAWRRQRDDELLAGQAVLPGVEQYLTDARQLGLRVGLASSSEHAWVDPFLSKLGLSQYFEAVCCRDDVGDQGKPDPAVYLAALAALRVKAGQSLALEDSPNGVSAAKKAGLYCVAVPNQMTRHLDFDRADYRLGSLASMPLTALIGQLAAGRQL
jgi:HAD superfamily hydrolase (TIGR01509 family)